jgi:hypothetical protein
VPSKYLLISCGDARRPTIEGLARCRRARSSLD